MGKNIFFVKKNIKISKLFPKHKLKKNFTIEEIKPLKTATKSDLTFFDSIEYKELAQKTKASACITNNRLEKYLPKETEKIIVENVLYELAKSLKKIYLDSDIDHFDSTLKTPKNNQFKDVRFGNNVLVGKNVKIGKNSEIGPNSIIHQNVIIGEKCVIGCGSIIRNSIIGDNVVVQDNPKIG